MVSPSNDNQLQLVLQAFERDPQFNIYKFARFYNIPCTTLSIWINGRSIRTNIIANSQKLIMLKKKVVVRKILDLNSQGFPLRIHDIENMVNRLLATYDTTYVGLCWVSNFVKRQLKLCTCWNRLYDYQKAQYEDLKIIKVWFRLFQNIVVKHSIIKSDIWNFDETGFLIG